MTELQKAIRELQEHRATLAAKQIPMTESKFIGKEMSFEELVQEYGSREALVQMVERFKPTHIMLYENVDLSAGRLLGTKMAHPIGPECSITSLDKLQHERIHFEVRCGHAWQYYVKGHCKVPESLDIKA